MKKPTCLFLCILLLSALAAPALADVIWEPENDFYFSHMDECERVDAYYEAQTDADVQKSPTQSASKGTILRGEEVYVYYDWHGWGYVEFAEAGVWTGGWVDLGSFRRLYGADDFLAAHEAEFTQETGSVSRADGERIVLWTFPGSGETAGVIDDGFDWADDPAYQSVWTDEAGRQWGRVGYYYGMRGWICLTDPNADDLPATAPRYAGEQPVPAETAGASVPILVIVLVAAVVLVTAGILFVLMRKKPKT